MQLCLFVRGRVGMLVVFVYLFVLISSSPECKAYFVRRLDLCLSVNFPHFYLLQDHSGDFNQIKLGSKHPNWVKGIQVRLNEIKATIFLKGT